MDFQCHVQFWINMKAEQIIEMQPALKKKKNVGERHGKVIVLIIDTEKMYQDGYHFQCTANNVWLTKEVPVKYIKNLND